MENVNKEVKIIKKNEILELKSTISGMKISILLKTLKAEKTTKKEPAKLKIAQYRLSSLRSRKKKSEEK